MTSLWRPDGGKVFNYSNRSREVFDVTGAGDVVASTLAAALAAGAPIEHAGWLANIAAGISVSRLGAAAVTQQDIISAIGDRQLRSEHKVMTRDEVVRLAAKQRACGRKVVFTNGCFDLLHVGHVNLLEGSRHEGDVLIVGINADASVKRLKGSTRPIQRQSHRTRIVAAQACVDAVVLFDEDTPYEVDQGPATGRYY